MAVAAVMSLSWISLSVYACYVVQLEHTRTTQLLHVSVSAYLSMDEYNHRNYFASALELWADSEKGYCWLPCAAAGHAAGTFSVVTLFSCMFIVSWPHAVSTCLSLSGAAKILLHASELEFCSGNFSRRIRQERAVGHTAGTLLALTAICTILKLSCGVAVTLLQSGAV